jgi:hypothetical protein
MERKRTAKAGTREYPSWLVSIIERPEVSAEEKDELIELWEETQQRLPIEESRKLVGENQRLRNNLKNEQRKVYAYQPNYVYILKEKGRSDCLRTFAILEHRQVVMLLWQLWEEQGRKIDKPLDYPQQLFRVEASYRTLMKYFGVGKKTAMRLLKDCVELGLIKKASRGHYWILERDPTKSPAMRNLLGFGRMRYIKKGMKAKCNEIVKRKKLGLSRYKR